MAKNDGWMAEHMLILGLTSPEGEKTYIAAAFPSACGKTNLAMLTPTVPGWKAETIGDDIAWMKFGEDGRLYAINPEAGFFGVAPGTSMDTNPNADAHTLVQFYFHKRRSHRKTEMSGGKEKSEEPPETLTSWLGEEWHPGDEKTAAHPNSRYTTPRCTMPHH